MLRKATELGGDRVETSLIEQFWYPKFGPGPTVETAAEVAGMFGDIRMNHRVTRLPGGAHRPSSNFTPDDRSNSCDESSHRCRCATWSPA